MKKFNNYKMYQYSIESNLATKSIPKTIEQRICRNHLTVSHYIALIIHRNLQVLNNMRHQIRQTTPCLIALVHQQQCWWKACSFHPTAKTIVS